jgi:signal transduction histidine kinase
LSTRESERHYDERDLALAQELAVRVSLAIENALLFRESEELEAAPVALSDVVERALETVRSVAEARGVRLDLGRARGEGFVLGDPARLQQIAWNLLSNAVKFTQAGGEVRVIVERRDDRMLLVVEDNGQGITPELLPRVFDRFRQGDSRIVRRKGGLGIGLEDEADTREVLTSVLTRAGAAVKSADSAAAGLDALSHAGFDLHLAKPILPHDLVQHVARLAHRG